MDTYSVCKEGSKIGLDRAAEGRYAPSLPTVTVVGDWAATLPSWHTYWLEKASRMLKAMAAYLRNPLHEYAGWCIQEADKLDAELRRAGVDVDGLIAATSVTWTESGKNVTVELVAARRLFLAYGTSGLTVTRLARDGEKPAAATAAAEPVPPPVNPVAAEPVAKPGRPFAEVARVGRRK